MREKTWDIHMSGRTDEAILRVDFLFDLATLEGRRKRAQFFKLINGAVGQVVPYTISWCICNAIQNRCTLRHCTVLIVRNVCAGVHMGVLWGGVQIGREHSLHNSVVNVIKNMCFMPGSWEPGLISMKSVCGVVYLLITTQLRSPICHRSALSGIEASLRQIQHFSMRYPRA